MDMQNLSQTLGSLLEKLVREHRLARQAMIDEMERVFQAEGYRMHQSGPQRILILRLDEIGDNVLTSAFLRELRRHAPQAEIDLVVKSGVFPLMELCPYVDRVLPATGFPKEDVPQSNDVLRWTQDYCASMLWPVHYDLCFLPRWDVDIQFGTMLAFLSGARERIGFTEHLYPWKEQQQKGSDAFLTRRIMTPPSVVHEVEKSLYMLHAVGVEAESNHIELWLEQADHDVARHVLAQAGDGPKIAVCVATREPWKDYPPDLLAKALRSLLNTGATFFLLGGKGERDAAKAVMHRLPSGRAVNLAGKTSLREAAALISQADLYMGGDTGLTHVAAAAHRPIVEWSTYPADIPVSMLSFYARFYPWQTRAAILRPAHAVGACKNLIAGPWELSGCHAHDTSHCIRTIPTEAIVQVARQLLGAKR